MPRICHGLHERILGCLLGSAVGDALGGPVEGLDPARIAGGYGTVDRMLPYREGLSPSFHGPFGLEAGEYTDDTRLAKLICAAIIGSGGSPRAGDIHKAIWQAYGRTDSVLERGFLEEYALKALYGAGKEAFGGKVTNGAIMAIAPMGVVYPGDPGRSFDAAFDILSMATGSARISAGIAAACISLALTGAGTAADIVMRALTASEARIHHTESSMWHYSGMYPRVGGWVAGLVRKAVALAQEYRDPMSPELHKALQAAVGQPFFADGDETLAVAVAMFVAAGGGYRAAVLGAVNYGKDCDSYAAVAGALAGAYKGIGSIPEDWIEAVEQREKPPALRFLAEGLCARVTARLRREGLSLAGLPLPWPWKTPGSMVTSGGPSASSDLSQELLAAVKSRDADSVQRLLSAGADPDTRGDTGRTCLHLACAAGALDIVCILLLFGTDIDAKDDNRTTALHFAAWENHPRIVELLLDWGIFPEETEGSGWTALHDAVRKEYADIPVIILSRSRGLRDADTMTGRFGALHGEDRFLALLGLLAEYQIDLGAIGICGHGLVHDAKKRGYGRAVQYLRSRGVPDEV